MKWSKHNLLSLALSAVLLAPVGCGLAKTAGNPGGMGGADGPDSEAKNIMVKIGKGPQALNAVIGKELKSEQPGWDALQPQAKEYAQLAAALGKTDPANGSRESWEKQTTAFAESAAALDRAAQAKDRDAATAAHTKLSGSCIACHREHRQMRAAGAGG